MLKRSDPAPAEELLRTAIHLFEERGELVRELSAVDRLAQCLDALGRTEEAAEVRKTAEERRSTLESHR
jgi:hypothetical protein